MEKFSISFTLGKAAAPHGANPNHNNRRFTASNVDEKRIIDNIIFRQQDVRDAYRQLFDRALQEYNAKQKRRDRIIPDYYLHIAESKREEAFYEIVVQFGDSETSPCGSARGDQAKQMLLSYMRDFQRRNPNLFVFNAVLHMDEASPHLHIDFIPFYTKGRKNGLRKGVSMKAALIEQGFRPSSPKENQLVMWEFSERAEMERVLRVHGCERDDREVHRKHLSVDVYKMHKESEKIKRSVDALLSVSADAKTQVRQLQIEIAESRRRILELEAAPLDWPRHENHVNTQIPADTFFASHCGLQRIAESCSAIRYFAAFCTPSSPSGSRIEFPQTAYTRPHTDTGITQMRTIRTKYRRSAQFPRNTPFPSHSIRIRMA